MKRILLTLALCLFAVSLAPQAFAACDPQGWVVIGPGSLYYNHIANGTPSTDSCWSPQAATFVSTTTCGYTSNAYEFGYGGSIAQSFTVPSDFTYTNWSFQFLVDFIDPNNDGAWNKFKAEVWDTSTNTLLGSYSFNGSQGDLYCSSRSFVWSGNLAGHTLRVRITGSKAYTDTYIRVRQMTLYQW